MVCHLARNVEEIGVPLGVPHPTPTYPPPYRYPEPCMPTTTDSASDGEDESGGASSSSSAARQGQGGTTKRRRAAAAEEMPKADLPEHWDTKAFQTSMRAGDKNGDKWKWNGGAGTVGGHWYRDGESVKVLPPSLVASRLFLGFR